MLQRSLASSVSGLTLALQPRMRSLPMDSSSPQVCFFSAARLCLLHPVTVMSCCMLKSCGDLCQNYVHQQDHNNDRCLVCHHAGSCYMQD